MNLITKCNNCLGFNEDQCSNRLGLGLVDRLTNYSEWRLKVENITLVQFRKFISFLLSNLNWQLTAIIFSLPIIVELQSNRLMYTNKLKLA